MGLRFRSIQHQTPTAAFGAAARSLQLRRGRSVSLTMDFEILRTKKPLSAVRTMDVRNVRVEWIHFHGSSSLLEAYCGKLLRQEGSRLKNSSQAYGYRFKGHCQANSTALYFIAPARILFTLATSGLWLPRGPATFSTLMFWSSSFITRMPASSSSSRLTTANGFLAWRHRFTVSRQPGSLLRRPFVKTTVASAKAILASVLGGYMLEGCSVILYLAGIGPASDLRPRGT